MFKSLKKDKEISNWKQLIEVEMKLRKDSFENVVSCTLTEDELLKEFDIDYGMVEGNPFTLWTKEYVYFPVVYDGAEWVQSVSRNPNGKPTEHIGVEDKPKVYYLE